MRLLFSLMLAFLLGAGLMLAVAGYRPSAQVLPVGQSVLDFATDRGSSLRALVISPPTATGDPRARQAVILLAGGHGNLGIGRDGSLRSGSNNQLVRTRSDYARRGLVTIVPDAADDFKVGEGTFVPYRWSEAHARDLASLVAFARQHASRVYVIGTSRAAFSVLAQASRPELMPRPDAFVVTSGMLLHDVADQPEVTREIKGLERIREPVLLVVHGADRCAYTPPARIEAFRAQLKGARVVDIVRFEGPAPASDDECGALSAHGFLGLDAEVVTAIVDWLGRVGGPAKP
ncbi:MAG: alpha/beta hydrolase family protein [Hyphomicrobiaceae bacterium]